MPTRSKRLNNSTDRSATVSNRPADALMPADDARRSAGLPKRVDRFHRLGAGTWQSAGDCHDRATDAFGRAPPNDEPGASSSRKSSSSSSSPATRMEAASKAGSSTRGGTRGPSPVTARNGPPSCSANRNAPCARFVVDAEQAVDFVQGRGGRFSAFARCRSARRINVRPQRSGAESPNAPNIA